MQSLIKLIFRVFIFLLPTQLAYHFWPDWALIFGIRVDYLSPAIYLTDLLAVVLFALVFFQEAKNKNVGKTTPFWRALLAFVFLNIIFAKIPAVAFLKWLKILELYLVFLATKKLNGLSFNKDFLEPLLFSSSLFSLIGISQFLKGGTLGGPLYFFGERSFTLLTPGISLAEIFGRNFIRAYSTFSHPNSLAGFLSIVLILALNQKKELLKRKIKTAAVGLVALGFFLSFSLGAWAALFFAYFFHRHLREKRKTPLFIVGAASLFLLFIKLSGPEVSLPEYIEKRLELATLSRQIFLKNPVLGVGLNNFTVVAGRHLQPVHNIFLLTLVETGVIGAALLLNLFREALNKSLKNKNSGFFISILFVFFVGLVDHYFLTLQQNTLLFSIILGYSQRRSAKK